MSLLLFIRDNFSWTSVGYYKNGIHCITKILTSFSSINFLCIICFEWDKEYEVNSAKKMMHFKMRHEGIERWLSRIENWLQFQRTWIWLPDHVIYHTICSPVPGVLYALLSSVSTRHVCDTQTHIKHTYI